MKKFLGIFFAVIIAAATVTTSTGCEKKEYKHPMHR